MKRIVSVSLGSSGLDSDFTTEFLGQAFHVRRVGADGDVRRAEALLAQAQDTADAIGIGMVRDHAVVGTRRFTDRLTARLEGVVTRVPVTTGAALRLFFDEWAVRYVQREEGGYFTNARTLFLSGMANYRSAAILAEYTRNLAFADPVMLDGVPKVLHSLRALETVRGRAGPPAAPSRAARPGAGRAAAAGAEPRRACARRWPGRTSWSRPTRNSSRSRPTSCATRSSSPRRSPTRRWRGSAARA